MSETERETQTERERQREAERERETETERDRERGGLTNKEGEPINSYDRSFSTYCHSLRFLYEI